jgi:hypothetical protein
VKKANLSKGWDAKPPVPFLRDSGVAQPVLNTSAHSFVRRMGFFCKEVKKNAIRDQYCGKLESR